MYLIIICNLFGAIHLLCLILQLHVRIYDRYYSKISISILYIYTYVYYIIDYYTCEHKDYNILCKLYSYNIIIIYIILL